MKFLVSESDVLSNPNDQQLGELVRQRYWDFKNMTDPQDKCVICGKESPYKISTHIDRRIGYIEGAGQGCFQPKNCGK